MNDEKPLDCEVSVGFNVLTMPNSTYIGIGIVGEGLERFWQIRCPCGVLVEYPLNGLPEIDTPHPCGNKNHWAVKYGYDAFLSNIPPKEDMEIGK